ncbi:hypothetical protein [Methylobacterium brachiatum]
MALWVAFLVHPVSLMAYATTAGSALLLWSLGAWDDGRRAYGGIGAAVAVALILGGFVIAASSFELPYCTPGQHLRGAAGRILWCAQVR